MNKNQRSRLQKALDIITEVKEEEEEKMGNMEEYGLDATDNYIHIEEGQDKLETIAQDLESVIEGDY